MRGHALSKAASLGQEKFLRRNSTVSCQLVIFLEAAELMPPPWRRDLGVLHRIQYWVQFNFFPFKYSLVPVPLIWNTTSFVLSVHAGVYFWGGVFFQFFSFINYLILTGWYQHAYRYLTKGKGTRGEDLTHKISRVSMLFLTLWQSLSLSFLCKKYPHLSCSHGMCSLLLILQD